jgi:hypothetical protein
MLKRGVMLLGGLSAAVGVPMAISGGGEGTGGEPGMLSKLWSNVAGSDKPPASAASPTAVNPLSRIQPASQPGTPDAAMPPGLMPPEMLGPRIDGHPTFDPGEVFRFDVSPAWIMSRWARVSTISVPPDLQGFRVPLVTGPSPNDLAGSLTYYFNAKDAVQRITFVGTTGDPTTLANLVTKRFRFVAVPSPMPNEWLYQLRWHNQPRSELRLRLSDIVRADAPYQRFDVDMEINLPDVPPSRPLTAAAKR